MNQGPSHERWRVVCRPRRPVPGVALVDGQQPGRGQSDEVGEYRYRRLDGDDYLVVFCELVSVSIRVFYYLRLFHLLFFLAVLKPAHGRSFVTVQAGPFPRPTSWPFCVLANRGCQSSIPSLREWPQGCCRFRLIHRLIKRRIYHVVNNPRPDKSCHHPKVRHHFRGEL
jgi:hypothetical protein